MSALDAMIGSSRCLQPSHRCINRLHLQKSAAPTLLRNRSYFRPQAAAKARRKSASKQTQHRTPTNGTSSGESATQSSPDSEHLTAEIERLRAENARIKAKIAAAVQSLRASGSADSRTERLSQLVGFTGEAEDQPSEAGAEISEPPPPPPPPDAESQEQPAAAAVSPSIQDAVEASASSDSGASSSLEFLEFKPPSGSTAKSESHPQPAAQAEPSSGGSAAVGSVQQPPQPPQQQRSQQTAQSPAQAVGGPQQPQGEQAEQLLDIVFVSSEAGPWSKTGGLGDVVGSLPIALARRGHRVMVVTPRYQNGTRTDQLYDVAKNLKQPLTLDLGACGPQTVDFFHLHRDNVDWVFVDHPSYHRPGGLYTDQNGVFGDNQFRFSLLSMAACEAPLTLNIGGHRVGWPPGFPYGDKCVFVANDWHASLVPLYLAAKYRRHGVYKDARTVLAIHNLAHQGVEPASTFANLGLPEDMYEPMGWAYPEWSHINGPAINLLKGGVLTADRVMTVSKGYAWEITTPEGGWGLDGVLQTRGHVLNGIANGIDMAEWDPSNDPHIEQPYSAADPSGKAACKAALQRELGLPVDASIPLLGFIGRLDHQKGPDLVLQAAGEFSARGVQTVMLGSGAEEYESGMRDAERQFPHQFRGWVGFSIPVAHRIIAGCDALLMPSRFEPCGLNQLFAMRYGTIPIAHATGGLRDTIAPFQPDKAGTPECGSGFIFSPPDMPAMMQSLDSALHVFRNDAKAWQGLQAAGMCQDLSWEKAAKQYEELFGWALLDPAVRPW